MPKFAAVQMESVPMDPEANLRRLAEKAEQLNAQKVDLAVFPECLLTGYMLTAEEAEQIAEPIPGGRTDQLQSICQQAGLMIAVGTIERHAGDYYNSMVLVGPQGVVASYRKTHLPFLGVDRYLACGDILPAPVATPAGRVGMLICYDLRFPETSRSMALRGAQVILLSTAWPVGADIFPDFMVQSRASESRIYVVAANRVGLERGQPFLGRSLIANPFGKVEAEASLDQEEILVATVDLQETDRKRLVFVPGEYELDIYADRRPELYDALVEPNSQSQAQTSRA